MLLLVASGVSLYLHRASDVEGESSPSPVTDLVGFFGVGNLPVLLAAAVFCAGAGAGGALLTALWHESVVGSCPIWFPFLALATGAGVGLGALRIACAVLPPGRP